MYEAPIWNMYQEYQCAIHRGSGTCLIHNIASDFMIFDWLSKQMFGNFWHPCFHKIIGHANQQTTVSCDNGVDGACGALLSWTRSPISPHCLQFFKHYTFDKNIVCKVIILLLTYLFIQVDFNICLLLWRICAIC